jgi:hypothetical protein
MDLCCGSLQSHKAIVRRQTPPHKWVGAHMDQWSVHLQAAIGLPRICGKLANCEDVLKPGCTATSPRGGVAPVRETHRVWS